MLRNQQVALNFVWEFDGLRHDEAPGEAFTTSYGVTEFTYRAAVAAGLDVPRDITQATQVDCGKILLWYGWDNCRCNDLPIGVDLMVFNDAVLSGSGHARLLLQRCVGVIQDGIMGPETMSTVMKTDPSILCARIYAADRTYLAALRNAPLFLKGWMRREDECLARAQSMIYAQTKP